MVSHDLNSQYLNKFVDLHYNKYMNQFIELKQAELQNAVDFFKKDIASLRIGRVSPSLLEGIQVKAYGAKSLINSLANINLSDGSSIIVAPWDKNIIKEIEKAIVEANLGINVVNEGDRIRITIPPMTEENRKDIVKKLNEKLEKSRIAIRQIREDIKGLIETAEENKEISEDEKFRFIKELDEEVGKRNNEIKELRDKKEEEIMTV